MASRATRTSVRTSKPAQQPYQQQQQYHHQQQYQQHHQLQQQQQQQQQFSRSFVSGGSVQPNNTPVVTYATPPAAPQQPPPPPPPKTEMKDRDGDVTMAAADGANAEVDPEVLKAQKKKFFQEMKKVTGVRKKPSKQMVQRRLRKHLTPKNATMALQEASPGAAYQFAVMPGSSPPLFTAEVEVDGKKYHGVGSNKSLARAAAAERALQSLVRSPTTTTDGETGKETVEDPTPWSALAGFALHKLFCDWRQGRVGAPLSVDAAGPPADEASARAGQAAAAAAAAAFKSDTPATEHFQSFTPPVMRPAKTGDAKEKKPKPAKQLPTDAAGRHPVMLLHEMRPTVAYEVKEMVLPQAGGGKPSITVAVSVDGQTFQAKGPNKKLAKKLVAKAANTAIFGIQYPAEME